MAKNTKASSNAREPRCAILKPSTPCFRTQRLLAGDNAAGISRLDLEIDALRKLAKSSSTAEARRTLAVLAGDVSAARANGQAEV